MRRGQGTTPTSLPIIVLSAASDVSDKVLLLELGADDYVTKPALRELLARVRAKLRHTTRTPDDQVVSFDDISVDFKKVEVKREGKTVSLTAHEFRTLQFLVQNADRVISRDELLKKVWGYRIILRRAPSTPTFSSSAKNWRKTHPGRYISVPYTTSDTCSFADCREPGVENIYPGRSFAVADCSHNCCNQVSLTMSAVSSTFSSVLVRALRRARHFALVEMCHPKARSQSLFRSGTQSDPCITSVTTSIMITTSYSSVKEKRAVQSITRCSTAHDCLFRAGPRGEPNFFTCS